MSLDPALESITAGASNALLREALEDFLRRRKEGDAVSEESLIERFPQHREEIRRRLEALEKIDLARRRVEDEQQAQYNHETLAYTSKDDPLQAVASNRLWVRCSHCQSANAIAPDAPIDHLTCVACLREFSLLPAPDSPRNTPVGAIAHFQLFERIGMGGFGAVWKAFDTELERIVAIKIPRKDRISAADIEQFLHEARVAAQLSHPHIVTIHEIGRWEDLHYIVSDFIEGTSLTEWIKQKKPTRVQAAKLCALIARALHEAHECGIVHRDLKPGNILIDEKGEPHLTDFGLAKTADRESDSRRTKDGQVMGTPAYMSPEQAKGDSRTSDRRSDVYSLGVVLFELLTGELPFRGNTRALIHQVIHNEAPSPRRLNHNIERDLETICLKCLQKEPRRRFATALEVAEELERFLSGEPIRSRPIDTLERSIRWAQRNSATALIAACSILALAALDFLYAYSKLEERTARQAIQQQDRAQDKARALQQQLSRYRYVVQQFAENPRLRELFEQNHGSVIWSAEALAEIQRMTVENDARLNDPAHGFLMEGERDPFENWFVMDADGHVRGHSPTPQVDNYAYRDYFRGALRAAEQRAKLKAQGVLGQKTYVSRIYKSVTDGAYKFGISAPIYSLSNPDQVVGVVMASILAGRARDPNSGEIRSTQLTSLTAAGDHSFSVLVGPFDDSDPEHPAQDQGESKVYRIVQHPAYAHLSPDPASGAAVEEAIEFPALGASAAPPADTNFRDPLGKYDPAFARRWIAGFARVPDTPMLVITQESYEMAVAPMGVLFRHYLFWGLLLAIFLLWIASVLVWRWINSNHWPMRRVHHHHA